MRSRATLAGLGLLAAALALAAGLWLWPEAGPSDPAPSEPGPDVAAALADLDPELRPLFRRLVVGADAGAPVVRKWARPMTVSLGPGATEADRRATAAAVAELNAWIPRPGVRLRPGGGGAVDIELVDRGAIDPAAAPFPVELEVEGAEIRGARIAIPRTGIDQRRRSRFLYHALGRALGLVGRLERPTDSIFFYGPGFSAWSYSPTDRALVTTLYRPEIPAGTTAATLDAALESLGPAHSD